MALNKYMKIAMTEARKAGRRGDVPVGAVIVEVSSGRVLAQAGNRVEADSDPTGHAEILVLREVAIKVCSPRLSGCDIYVTLEPCPMCAQAISFSRIRRLYFGAYDSKNGAVDHGVKIFSQKFCNHKPEIIGSLEEKKCSNILKEFFDRRRQA